MPELVDEHEDRGADLRVYGRTLWRQRWVIVITVVAVVAAGLLVALIETPQYRATADILIQQSEAQQTLDSTPPDAATAARNVDTEVAILQSKVILDAATKRLGHKPDITISSNSATSDVVGVTAQNTSAKQAAIDANGYTAAYLAYRQKQNLNELVQAQAQVQAQIAAIATRIPTLPAGSSALTTAQEQLSFLQQEVNQLQVSANLNNVGGPTILDRASVPTSPSSPKPLRYAAIAFVLGVLLAIGLAFVREYLNDTIRSREDLEGVTRGVPVLAEVPTVRSWRHSEVPFLVTMDEPASSSAEAYRKLRTSIQFLSVDRKLGSIQVTSAQADEGKTTTLANAAVAFAQAGRRVAVVGFDLRRPRIHEFFGLSNDVGFTSVLLGEASMVDALRQVPLPSSVGAGEHASLVVLPAGPPAPNPSELLSSRRAAEVLEALEKTGHLVLVDSPPVLPVSDALIISGNVDETLVVASAGSSSRRSVHRAVEVLNQVNASIMGTVLNNAAPTGAYETTAYGYTPKPAGSNSDGARRKVPSKSRRETTGAAG